MTRKLRYNNRRKFPRFKVDTGLFVIHSDFGKVQEVGIGGLVFHYLEKDRESETFPATGVLFSQDDDYLVELPFKTISDISIQNSFISRFNLRKRTIIFGELESEQLDQLETLILNNVVIPIQEECLVTMMTDVSCYQDGYLRQGEESAPAVQRW